MKCSDDNINLIDLDNNHFDNYSVNFESHSVDSFKNKYNAEHNSLKIVHHNTQSLMTEGRMDEYHIFLQTLNNPFDTLVFFRNLVKPRKSRSL